MIGITFEMNPCFACQQFSFYNYPHKVVGDFLQTVEEMRAQENLSGV